MKMKKIFLFFAVFMLFFVVACGGNDRDVNDNGENDSDADEDNSDTDEITEQCDLEPYYECRDSNSYYCQANSVCEYECELFEWCDGCCLEGGCAYDCGCNLEPYSECHGSDLYYCGVYHPCQYGCELECEGCCGS